MQAINTSSNKKALSWLMQRAQTARSWVVLSIGAIVLLAYGAWHATQAFLADADVPGFVKVAVFAVAVGGLVLLVSVAREKLFTSKRDPYKEIER